MHFSPLSSPQPMHIPDGFLSVLVSAVFWVFSVILVGIALRKTSQTLGERQIPLMGVLAAAIFAGQMLNFSVGGGTSGHLLGAALATILLGPWAAILVMTSVVTVQALLFQDGGILALGANIFNMAIVGVLVAHAVYTLTLAIFRHKGGAIFTGGFVAAWGSIFMASLACAIQLALSGTSPANIAIPAMASIHAVIGIGEGLITLGALVLIYAARRDLLTTGTPARTSGQGLIIGGLGIAALLAVASPLASSHPDGLEWVAEQNGFIDTAREAAFNIIPDYTLPGISNEALATILAGLVGMLVVFAVAYATGRANRKTV